MRLIAMRLAEIQPAAALPSTKVPLKHRRAKVTRTREVAVHVVRRRESATHCTVCHSPSSDVCSLVSIEGMTLLTWGHSIFVKPRPVRRISEH
jgi:hypothetical protein